MPRLTEGNFTPEADRQGLAGSHGAQGGQEPADSPQGDLVSSLSRGGSSAAATIPGAADVEPTGGGRAVPDAAAFENQGALGVDSLDDGAFDPIGGVTARSGNDSAAGAPI